MEKFELKIREELEDLRDEKYADFIARGVPGVPRNAILGVRVPEIRRVARENFNAKIYHEMNKFLEDLPHGYREYNLLHVFLIAEMKDFEGCMTEVEKFLPYVDNWEVADAINPKAFSKHPSELLGHIMRWVESEHAWTVRVGVVTLLRHFLGERYVPKFSEKVAEVAWRAEDDAGDGPTGKHGASAWTEGERYYVRMAAAWYFAELAAKNPEAARGIFAGGELPKVVQNRGIQKACESFRVSREMKEELRGLRK